MAIFKITKQVLDDIKEEIIPHNEEGVPDSILEDLKTLEKKGFNKKTEFLKSIKEKIGEEKTSNYKELIESILKYSSIFERLKKDISNNIELLLVTIMIVAVVFGMVVIGLYFFNFHHNLSSNQNVWGTFGDYIGGTLNPIFAFLGLIAILITIVIQRKELTLSKKELKLSREELGRSAEALESQNITAQLQRFESTFFQLIQLQNNIIHDIDMEIKLVGGMQEGFTHCSGQNCFKHLYHDLYEMYHNFHSLYYIKEEILEKISPILKDNIEEFIFRKKGLLFINMQYLNEYKERIEDDFINANFDYLKDKERIEDDLVIIEENKKRLEEREFIKYLYEDFMDKTDEKIGQYFRNLYHIVDFINQRYPQILKDNDVRIYSRLVRTQLSKFEIGLLFYNCLSDYGERFKPLIEKYSLLKGIDYNILFIPKHKDYYAPSAYGESI